ncbi:MAG: sulfatase [Anaerolineales bacterium]
MNKPNFILLTIDTLRADMLHSYGNATPLAPHLDGLAASGIRFEQAITGGSWTQAAFPVLLTSSYAAMYGGCLGRLAPERPSPVETLAKNGYRTGGFSTNLHLSQRTGYNRGFHHFADLSPGESDPWLRQIKVGQRLLQSPIVQSLLRPIAGPLRPARLYASAAEVTNALSQWLERVEKPFFAWAHYMDLHWPYHLEEELTHPHEIAQAWQDLAIMHSRSNSNSELPMTTAQRDRSVELYGQSLRYVDKQIGRLLRDLERLGCDEDTVIIAVSDHGEEFLDHGRWGHWESNLFDEIIRVPLIIRMPDGPAGQVVRRQVRLLDLMPTILDLGGCPPNGVMGSSLVPLWTESEPEYDGVAAVSEMRRDPRHRIAIRTEEFKYIWDSQQPGRPELYDLQADPGETRNVSMRFPAEVRRFQAKVDAHRRRVAETEPAAPSPELTPDAEVTRRLRDLGYLE